MNRVRQEVLAKTKGQQRTWDQSSLMSPFYFNPGSMFLFMGNALALFGLLLSIIPYSFALSSSRWASGSVYLAALAPLISLCILMFGMQSVYARLRGNSYNDADKPPTALQHIGISLQKGMLGGYLGALVASPGISYLYYQEWDKEFWASATVSGQPAIWFGAPESLGRISVEISIAAAFVASVLGVLTLTFARVNVGRTGIELTQNFSKFRTFVGTVIGGALTGLLAAPLVTLYFASLKRPYLLPDMLLPGSIAGAAFIVFSIVNFDFERLSLKRLITGAIAAVGGVLVGILVSVLILGPIHIFGFYDDLVYWMRTPESNFHFLVGGAVYGVPVGVALGFIIGTAIILTEWWSGRSLFWREPATVLPDSVNQSG